MTWGGELHKYFFTGSLFSPCLPIPLSSYSVSILCPSSLTLVCFFLLGWIQKSCNGTDSLLPAGMKFWQRLYPWRWGLCYTEGPGHSSQWFLYSSPEHNHKRAFLDFYCEILVGFYRKHSQKCERSPKTVVPRHFSLHSQARAPIQLQPFIKISMWSFLLIHTPSSFCSKQIGTSEIQQLTYLDLGESLPCNINSLGFPRIVIDFQLSNFLVKSEVTNFQALYTSELKPEVTSVLFLMLSSEILNLSNELERRLNTQSCNNLRWFEVYLKMGRITMIN